MQRESCKPEFYTCLYASFLGEIRISQSFEKQYVLRTLRPLRLRSVPF